MTSRLRVGTRGSALALWQTNWVCQQLRALHPGLEIEQTIIKTHGDVALDRSFGKDWPVGAFVSALEKALLEKRVDFAVHSFKDLQTAETEGLTIAATPVREVVHDLLLTRSEMRLDDLPRGARIGTSSPRRKALFLRLGDFEIVPIRGNVPTRITRIERDGLDGVVVAAAGVKRLGIKHPHVIELPTDKIVPAPAQGALAIQTRVDDPAQPLIASLNHAPTRRAVDAERSVLSAINAGCHTPVGALAQIDGEQNRERQRPGLRQRQGTGSGERGTDAARIHLHAILFSDDFKRCAEGVETGDDPRAVGAALARRLLDQG